MHKNAYGDYMLLTSKLSTPDPKFFLEFELKNLEERSESFNHY